jgi:hypothetical protein
MGLVFAGFRVGNIFPPAIWPSAPFFISLLVIGGIAYTLIQIPVKNAGSPDEPAPPTAVM